MPFRMPGSSRHPQPTYTEPQVIWGVPLREGYSDDDDPRAHQGVSQHAFEIGSDDKAICGFEPPKRSHGTYRSPRAMLGLPSARYNPRCKKCAALIVSVSSGGDAATEPAAAVEPRPGEMIGAHVAPRSDAASMLPAAQALAEELAEEEPIGTEPEPEPAETEPAMAQPAEDDDAAEDTEAQGDEAVVAIVERESIEPESWVAEASAAAGGGPMTEVGWQGSLTVPAGKASAVIDDAEAVGAQVVARVVRGPKGIFVQSVEARKGKPTVILNDAAEEPVMVAWLVVPDLGLTGGNTD